VEVAELEVRLPTLSVQVVEAVELSQEHLLVRLVLLIVLRLVVLDLAVLLLYLVLAV
jgi:hypothetical protein